jgi:hypothetical protein
VRGDPTIGGRSPEGRLLSPSPERATSDADDGQRARAEERGRGEAADATEWIGRNEMGARVS